MGSRIATLCYATDQGLGVLAKSFYDNGVVTDPIVVVHSHWPTHFDWYPGAPACEARRFRKSDPSVRAALHGCDAVLFFETPFDWELIPWCKSQGIRTALMPMYECTPYPLPRTPDVVLNPSGLDYQTFKEYGPHLFQVPVQVPWRLRQRCRTYVHNAGHLGLKSRNGTGVILDAFKYSKAPYRFILRSQSTLPWEVPNDPRLDLRIGTVPYESLWTEGDCFVFPEKFNGLSLPLQEACASGMVVMATDRWPMNSWLPSAPLIPVDHYERERIGGAVPFDAAIVDPKVLGEMLDTWYDRDVQELSMYGHVWAQENSWDKLREAYKCVILGT